jgi:hypothetical protein
MDNSVVENCPFERRVYIGGNGAFCAAAIGKQMRGPSNLQKNRAIASAVGELGQQELLWMALGRFDFHCRRNAWHMDLNLLMPAATIGAGHHYMPG